MGGDLETYFLEKGYRNDVSVVIENESYEMYFFLASTLEYELTTDGYCTYPGLVILENISTNNIEVAIQVYRAYYSQPQSPHPSFPGR